MKRLAFIALAILAVGLPVGAEMAFGHAPPARAIAFSRHEDHFYHGYGRRAPAGWLGAAYATGYRATHHDAAAAGQRPRGQRP